MSNTKKAILFRNKEDLKSIEKIDIDAGSLWKLNQETNQLVLVDDDQHVTHAFEKNNFIKAT